MMKRPDWIMECLKAVDNKPQGRDQITIIAMAPGAARNGQMSPISTSMSAQPEQSRMTGEGEDGMMQPGKVAGDVHEGEMVLSANATQALPEDVRQELTRQAESGDLDVNALRTALKLQPQPGFQAGSNGMPVGGGYNPISQKDIITKPSIGVTNDVKDLSKSAADAFQPIAAPTPERKAPSYSVAGQVTGGVLPAFNTNPTVIAAPVITRDVPKGETISVNTQAPVPVQTLVAPPSFNRTAPTGEPITLAPIEYTPPAQTLVTPPQFTHTAPTGEPITINTAPAPAAGTKAPTYYDNVINNSLRRTIDTAEGKSAAETNIANQNLKSFDTRASNELAANEMNLATRTDLPEGTKGSLIAQANSGVRSSRSELIGDMSAGAAERAAAANVTAANIASGQQTFKEGVRQYDQNFGENKRVGDRAYDANQEVFKEGVRQYDQNFSENKRVGDRAYDSNQAVIERQNTLQDIQALTAAGITENAPAIIDKFKSLGVSIDPSYLVAGEKSTRFNDAMSTFTTLVATPGMTAAGAISAMKQSGKYDALAGAFGGTEAPWIGDPAANPLTIIQNGGVPDATGADWLIDNGYKLTGERADNGGVTALFNSMTATTNPLDAAVATINNSTSLNATEKKNMVALLKYQYTGGDMTKVTYDKDGNPIFTTTDPSDPLKGYTGSLWGQDAIDILKTGKTDPNYQVVLDNELADITTKMSVDGLFTIPAGPARNTVIDYIKGKATAWNGATSTAEGSSSFVSKPMAKSVITLNGKTYLVNSDTTTFTFKAGDNKVKTYTADRFTAIDIATGQPVTVQSGSASTGGGGLLITPQAGYISPDVAASTTKTTTPESTTTTKTRLNSRSR